MGVKSFYIVIFVFGVIFLSSCRVSEPTSVESVASQQNQEGVASGGIFTPRVTSRVVTENGYPVGIRLDEEQILRFISPGAKLYTDPLAFERAVQEGLNGFLISLDRPQWLQTCELVPEKTFMQCGLENRTVYLQEQEVSEYTVWLSVPVDHITAESELQEIGSTLSLEAITSTSGSR